MAMTMNKVWPAHIAGFGGRPGGISLTDDGRVRVIDAQGRELGAAVLERGWNEAAGGLRVAEMFPGVRWYIHEPWVGKVSVDVTQLQPGGLAQGQVFWQRDDATLFWSAGPRSGTWDFSIPMPPGHVDPLDIVLLTRLAGAVWDLLGGYPGEEDPDRPVVAHLALSNLFGPGVRAEIPEELPFYVAPLGRRPYAYLQRQYGLE